MKTQNKLKLVLSVVVITMLLLTVSCDAANNPSALVGHWLYESGYTDRKKPEKSIELFKDGTGVCDGYPIQWKVENKRFILLASFVGIAADYKVSNFELTLIYDDGTSATFVKKGYAEQAKEARIAAIKAEVKKGSLTDARDNKTYKTVKVGKQTWMAENLNFNANGSKCYGEGSRVLASYDEKTDTYKDTITLSKVEIQTNCNKYGRLYDWETAKKACPKGWHLPSMYEWETLVDIAGGYEVAGKALKARSGWNSDNGKSGNGTDDYGFSALPGGNYYNGYFSNVGDGGSWWGINNKDAYRLYNDAYRRYIDYDNEGVNYYYGEGADDGLLSVRCLQDSP
jgi:Fibrobacter succinogenes major domain (Fib_succ_major).